MKKRKKKEKEEKERETDRQRESEDEIKIWRGGNVRNREIQKVKMGNIERGTETQDEGDAEIGRELRRRRK